LGHYEMALGRWAMSQGKCRYHIWVGFGYLCPTYGINMLIFDFSALLLGDALCEVSAIIWFSNWFSGVGHNERVMGRWAMT
jgi:hypothetical protein